MLGVCSSAVEKEAPPKASETRATPSALQLSAALPSNKRQCNAFVCCGLDAKCSSPKPDCSAPRFPTSRGCLELHLALLWVEHAAGASSLSSIEKILPTSTLMSLTRQVRPRTSMNFAS